ncbi:helix-turn-helix transcriptional regulator [Streptomyces sp. D2-8]|uniref:helix-turn-helix domain-containing protein n=1 Tax=Streptomyces sp. D2-8 TaxID=2707767 RepID=UPI0020C07D88|nr:AraC family transcriptional regulator [Streptomyces sp. D2-8]MCK8434895.1 helix-turn-helix transcriptional regulator [Streptomyces sp. D2-8]
MARTAEESPVALTVRPSAPPLVPLIGAMGYAEGRFAHSAELALPTGAAQLLVNLDVDALSSSPLRRGADRRTRGAAVHGPFSEPAVIDPAQQRAVLWVAFRPAGARPFLAAPVSAVRDELVGLDELWGTDGAVLRERLLEAVAAGGPRAVLRALEAALLGRAEHPLEPDPAVRLAAALLGRGAPVGEVADRLGWTARRLARSCTEQLGLPPKRYARIRRLQRLLRRVNAGHGPPEWAVLAADCGYHDQAHLIHEFRALAGITPTAYTPRSPLERNHVPLGG